mmetsp:Transcript_25539/g.42627  ORF Transcript_25539/g.42627 Transcript_25539/m.42627 type:complete len:307 (-) Transcript_25539:1468-2388(-)
MAAMPVVLVTGGYDHKIRFWDATSGVCTKSISFGESQVNCIQVSSDKSLLAAGGNPMIQLFDVNAIDERPLLSYDGHAGNVTTIGFQRDQKWLFSSSEDGSVRIWDTRSNNFSRKYDSGSPVNTVSLHASQSELVSGDQSGVMKVWDLAADKCREEYVPLVDVPLRSISLTSDGSFVAAGSHKGRVFIYTPDQQKGGLILSKEYQAHEDYLLKCVISPDSRSIATTSADKTIKLWDTSDFSLESTLNKHQRWVWDCVYSADSLYLLTASSDQSAKLWDLRTGDVIRNYVGHNLAVTCVALNDTSLQ